MIVSVAVARILPAYLEDLRQAAVAGRMEERMLIEFLVRVLAIVTNASSRKILRELKVDVREFFAGLDATPLPKLRAFLEKRLPRSLPKLISDSN